MSDHASRWSDDRIDDLSRRLTNLNGIVTEVAGLKSELKGLAVHDNCHNSSRLAKIERRYFELLEARTATLLPPGIPFGIPPKQIPRLVKANREDQAFFLSQLDALAAENCH